jgi:hypothetical protein
MTSKRIEEAINAARDARDKVMDMHACIGSAWWGLNRLIGELEKERHGLEVDRVTYSGPVTVVVWKDGTVTRTRCQEGDEYSKEVGFLMCVAKKALPNWHGAMSEHVWGQE